VEEEDKLAIEYKSPFKEPADALHPFTGYTLHDVDAQDFMSGDSHFTDFNEVQGFAPKCL